MTFKKFILRELKEYNAYYNKSFRIRYDSLLDRSLVSVDNIISFVANSCVWCCTKEGRTYYVVFMLKCIINAYNANMIDKQEICLYIRNVNTYVDSKEKNLTEYKKILEIINK